MKKLILLILLIPSLVYGAAGDVASVSGKAITAISSIAGKANSAILTLGGKPVSDGDAAALLFSESFNGASDCDGAGAGTDTNCDNTGWTSVTGTTDYSGTGIAGTTYSLVYTGVNTESYHAVSGHTGTTKLYAAERFEATTGDATSFRTLGIFDSSGNIIAYAFAIWSTDHYNMRMYYYNSAGSLANSTCTVDIDDDEVWYVKLEYTPGTSTNGVVSMFVVADDSGFPGWGSACTTYALSTSTANVGRIHPGRSANADQIITIQGVKVDVNDIAY